MNKRLNDIANEIIVILKCIGFTIHRYDAYSTNSIYLKLDYGVCNSIRISDHTGKKYLKYRYNMILDGKTEQTQDIYERFYYNQNTITEMIDKIISDREEKLKRYGQKGYNYFMKRNNEDSSDKKGFWQKAKII